MKSNPNTTQGKKKWEKLRSDSIDELIEKMKSGSWNKNDTQRDFDFGTWWGKIELIEKLSKL